MNSVFIDSNAIIKYFTGDTTAKDALAPVINYEVEGYINSKAILTALFTLKSSISL